MLKWHAFNALGGKYEAIIYKLYRDYGGVRTTPYFGLASFRKYIGIEEHECKGLVLLVIAGLVKAINASELSDLTIEVDYENVGRKVIGRRFIVMRK